MALTEVQRGRFHEYSKEKKSVFSNRIVEDFFSKEQNIELLLRANDGDNESQKELEERFRKHFFRVRFVKFLVSTIKYCAIDQMRMNQKYDIRNQLIFDRPTSEGNGTLGELLLCNQKLPESEPIIANIDQFQASFSNEQLASAFMALSHKQQLIVTLSYAMSHQDNEIARIIGVSPQAVCKTRNLALQKLRLAMPERR
ncbi:sigma-70 family RNA polymerase sigma factor [Cohnella suwonensis]|uniref:Sigma-70 family RNA polymerase sigma factor n=1 Tax=Cohnella suwonensis TaxID=696072 RepID=A0ABW0LW99_9BACL